MPAPWWQAHHFRQACWCAASDFVSVSRGDVSPHLLKAPQPVQLVDVMWFTKLYDQWVLVWRVMRYFANEIVLIVQSQKLFFINADSTGGGSTVAQSLAGRYFNGFWRSKLTVCYSGVSDLFFFCLEIPQSAIFIATIPRWWRPLRPVITTHCKNEQKLTYARSLR